MDLHEAEFSLEVFATTVAQLNNEEAIPLRGPMYLPIRTIGTLVFSALGILCNLTALFLLLYLANLKNTQIILVINMCVINLLSIGIVQPIFGYIQLTGPLPYPWCQTHAYFTQGIGGGVMSALFLITLHRYFIIILPNSSHFSMGKGKKPVCIILVTHLLIHILMCFPLFKIGGIYGFDAISMNCTLVRDGPRTFYFVCLLLGIAMPLILKFVAYIHIFSTVYRQRKKISTMNDNNKHAGKRQRSEIRLTVVSCVLVLVFILSFIPYFIASSSKALERNDYFHAIATVLLHFHTFVNPVIYLYGDGNLRTKISNLILKRKTLDRDQITSISVQ